jgi:peptide deformylase
MALLNIRTYGDPILRATAKPVAKVTPEIKQLIEEMIETMHEAPGIGLAAPQIGKSIRLIIVTFGLDSNQPIPRALINPEIVAHSEIKEVFEEGCLSVPGETSDIERWSEITVKSLDANGSPIEFEARNITARILQHEIDHLNGVLFVDRIPVLKQDIIKRRLRRRLKKVKAA